MRELPGHPPRCGCDDCKWERERQAPEGFWISRSISLTGVHTPSSVLLTRAEQPPSRPQEANMFATLAAAQVAAAESFAADERIAAVYFEVAGTEVRISRDEVAA